MGLEEAISAGSSMCRLLLCDECPLLVLAYTPFLTSSSCFQLRASWRLTLANCTLTEIHRDSVTSITLHNLVFASPPV